MAVTSSPIGREAGRGLLTLANVITAVAPVAADWNNSHIFNQRWPSHARFHGVVALTMTSTLASLNLWSLWSDSTDRRTSRLFAAAIPVGYWAPSWWRRWSGTRVRRPAVPDSQGRGRTDQPARRGGHYPHGCGWLAAITEKQKDQLFICALLLCVYKRFFAQVVAAEIIQP